MIADEVRFRLLDMRNHAREALDIVNGEGIPDRVRALALQRLVSIVGEAATRVPTEVRSKVLVIDWRRATGMRHILVHDYANTNQDTVETTIRRDFPPLIRALDDLLSEWGTET